MPDPIPTEAVEAAARALCELDGSDPDNRAEEWVSGHFTAEVSDPAWTEYVAQATTALTAAAPHIEAQALQRAETALDFQTTCLRCGETLSQLMTLHERIGALRDEWRQRATDPTTMIDCDSAIEIGHCAAALDALLRERDR